MNSAHKQWDKYTVCTEDRRINIENNLTENAIRPRVIGRKNFLFCDTVARANASANPYSLIETAKTNEIEPYAYLKTVFTELPKATSLQDVEAVLPYQLSSEIKQAAWFISRAITLRRTLTDCLQSIAHLI